MKNFFFYLLVIFFVSCKKEVVSHTKSVTEVQGGNYKFQKVVFGPEKPSFTKEGTVVLNNDTLDVVYEYTDDIAFVQPTEDIYGNKGVYNYRDLLVHLVNSKNDTVTFRKEMFKKDIHPDDYKAVIMQGATLNAESKKGIVPLIIDLCMPESDFCYWFAVQPDSNGGFTITDVSEDFDMP